MPKPEGIHHYRGWALCIVATLLMGLLSGCGPRAPKPIVQQALAYQISHLPAQVGSLVGSEQLLTRLELQDVKIRRDRREPFLLASGETVEGHHLSGTYSLSVKLPGSRRPYRRKGDPFQLTLAHQKEQTQGPETLPERWLLAYSTPDSKMWEIIDFLPQPAPPLELPPAETAETVDLEPIPTPAAEVAVPTPKGSPT
ncbi:hypothetical protein L1047_01695 [Synechococcus sp. Nb3U1]|uniref:hypothetical protein n=1 Tax=Synechococcus sp. Nb3U1 TaxID=1914529 RepID=UPI001F39D872|nr:hypothetical protein [Synechococcus sp. Nb3U1]MCF2969908.1 hypothetical protein [Synechococcus sp. Nb3U1]